VLSARRVRDIALGWHSSCQGLYLGLKSVAIGKEGRAILANFRWRHVVALARVTASAAGQPAPGLTEARTLLGL